MGHPSTSQRGTRKNLDIKFGMKAAWFRQCTHHLAGNIIQEPITTTRIQKKSPSTSSLLKTLNIPDEVDTSNTT